MDFIILFALGAAAGGFINGLAGFGTALFALGFFLQIMPPVQGVAIVVVLSVLSGLQGVWIVRHSLMDNRLRLARFLLPALFGIPLGVAALSILDPGLIKVLIAAILILYGGFFTFRKSLPKIKRPMPVIDGVVGFLGGILGGAASLSGALPTMWCSMRAWSKLETRAVLQPFNVAVLGLTDALIAINGAYTFDTLKLIAGALPVTLLFAQIGITVFRKLHDDQFRRLLIAMMLVSGVVLMARELM